MGTALPELADWTTMLQPDDDDSLMSQVREGETHALGALFDRHSGPLFSYFLRLTGNRAASEDLLQEVFVRMLKYRRSYRPGSRFPAWMYHIARNAQRDFAHKRRGEVDWDDSYAPLALPRDTAEAAQHQALLERALGELPAEKREVLLLSRFQGLAYAEIGELLQCDAGTVKVRVHRAMKALRERFQHLAQPEAAS